MERRDDNLRVGIVGCGEAGEQKHLRVLRDLPGLKVVAVADRDPERLRRVADRHSIAGRHLDWVELLDRPDISAAGIAVPASDHVEIALAALARGKHVLIEKPLALSMDEACRLTEAAACSEARILVGFHMRWHRLVRRARDFVRSGALGRLESIRTLWYSPRSDDGLPAWRFQRRLGGGALVEIGVHSFNLWRFLLGSEVETIHALSRAGTRDDEAVIVSATMAGGVLASGQFSERTSHEIEIEICGSGGRLRVGCQRFDGFSFFPAGSAPGDVRARLDAARRFVAGLPRGVARMRKGADYLDSYRCEWIHFAGVAAGQVEPECTVADGTRCLMITLAAAESLARGVPVPVGPAPREFPPA
jgi:predicted dehydrogenase